MCILQALILFQTTDSENIILENDIKLPKLIAFEIHGNIMATNHSNNPPKIYITDKMFESIKNVKYINIQSVSLEKLTLESNEPVPIINTKIHKKENVYIFNELVPVLPNYLHKVNSNNDKKGLKFLQSKDIDILPYETYKKNKRGAKSNGPFFNSKDLLFLRVTNCGLKYISWDLFNGLDSLETLILDNNAIEYIPDFSFYGASMLKCLSLANNKIKYLQTTGLGGLLDLQYLNLKNNALTVLSETTFPPLPKLKVADISNNPIETVHSYTFEVLNSSTELILGSSDVKLYLHHNSFVGLDSLEKLHLININVTTLEQSLLIGLPKLIELNIRGSIKRIAYDAFIETPSIKRIILSNCSIQSISMDTFNGIYNLEHLDLSYNQLQELPPGLLNKQFLLQELILNNNQLINLPDEIFKTIPNVKLMRLDMNPLYCSCHMKSWDISLMTKSKKEIYKHSCEWDYLKKGYSCSMKNTVTYVYNKKLEPLCSSPEKIKGMTVSYVLRKYLNCSNKSNSMKINLNMKNKYKEFKLKQLRELYNKQNTSEHTTLISNSQLNSSPFNAKYFDNMSNNTTTNINNKNIENKTTIHIVDNISESIINKLSYITTEKSVKLNNGTYISKSSLKEEISKMQKKNKAKSVVSKILSNLKGEN